jgi:hypothetical protein
MPAERKQKHVIILGAGASKTSGYPLADRLRLLMSSETTLRNVLAEQIKGDEALIGSIIDAAMGGHLRPIIELFRHGGFGSVDEFSSLAYHKYADQVRDLKRLLRFALSLHDPEEKFHESDYYGFIQRLFRKDLYSLRDDISILTFNYDPYLPYLLRKAHAMRYAVRGKQPALNEVDAVTSGFTNFGFGALESEDGFCLLQLHGTIAWPDIEPGESKICADDILGKPIKPRMSKLCFSEAATSEPPIVFPWEVWKEDGGFIEMEDFCLQEAPRGHEQGRRNLHQLFVSIWKRAQKEITSAAKISFVGLSMHEFLNPAFNFLFKDKQDHDAKIVVANEDFANYQASDILSNRSSPATKVGILLRDVWTSRVDPTGIYGYRPELRLTFADFIKHEMY